MSRRVQFTLLTLVIIAIAARIALPWIVKHYVNHQLNKLPDYRGQVADIEIQLIRGAYKIRGLEIEKTDGDVPVPFISIPEMDLSVQWGELFHGSIVGEIEVTGAQVNFVNARSEEDQQTGMDAGWKNTLESLFPFNLNRFQVNRGDIRFRDFDRTPQVDLYVTNLFATATNLTNTREVTGELPAGLVARGDTIGGGKLEILLLMNPLADQPTFKLNAGVSNVNLVAMNDFMRAYGKFDVHSGTFQVYSEIAAANGRFEGYVKPFFHDLDIFDWDQERKKNIAKKFWEGIVSGVAAIFKNQPKDQLATQIPISGNFEETDIDLWATIGGILKNAFVRSLLPKIDSSVGLEDVATDSQSDDSKESSGEKD